MVDLGRSGRELEVDIESWEELEKMEAVGEEGWDSGRLKERVKVVLVLVLVLVLGSDDGGVGELEALQSEEYAGWG